MKNDIDNTSFFENIDIVKEVKELYNKDKKGRN